MHVLTKIFIVLVSLLACMLVPLVVAYSHNENSYQSMFQDAKAQAEQARSDRDSARTEFDLARQGLQDEVNAVTAENLALRGQIESARSNAGAAEQARVDAEARLVNLEAQLATLISANEVGQSVRETLLSEVRGLRNEMVRSEQTRVDLDEALQESRAQYEVAEKARRALEEELAQVKADLNASLDRVSRYAIAYGALPDENDVAVGMRPDRDLEAPIVFVRTTADETLAEIEAGSRDGVREGWEMTIGRDGEYVGVLTITRVDINRSYGVVSKVQPDMTVRSGDTAHAFARR